MAIGQPMESFKKEDVHMVHGNQERKCSDHGQNMVLLEKESVL